LRWAAFVDTASFDLASADGAASFDSSRALLRALMCRDGVEQMVRDASFAAAAEPPWGAWRASALVLSAEAHLLRGEDENAATLFAESSSVAAAQGNVGSFILAQAELGVLAMNRGRWPEAAEHVDKALATIDEFRMPDHAMSVLALAASARLAVQRGDRRGLDGQLTRAMRSRLSCTLALPYVAVRARLQLARVHAAIGDHAGASHLLREVDDILLHRPDLGTLVEQAATLRRILTANPHEAVVGGAPLTVAELRLLPYLQTHLTFREIGERLFVSRNTVSSEVGSIYRKLGVSSRSDAVDRATTLGLIGGS
jgi:LuxR family maltose regulon positive regulatory protein